MKTLIAWCVGGISLFFALTAFAAEQATPRQPVTLDTVVVTAKKTDAPIQTGDVDKEFTPVMVDTIEREEFEGQSENIAKIIDKEAGTQVRQSGGLGSFSSISLPSGWGIGRTSSARSIISTRPMRVKTCSTTPPWPRASAT